MGIRTPFYLFNCMKSLKFKPPVEPNRNDHEVVSYGFHGNYFATGGVQ